MKLSRTTLLAALLYAANLSGQTDFSSVPSYLQFFPRNQNNVCTFQVSGSANYPGYNQVRSEIINKDNNSVVEDKLIPLSGGSFNYSHQIPAMLAEYELRVYVTDGIEEINIKTVTRLVCGDLFIIGGQSNATAAADWDVPGQTFWNNYSLKYCRAIGTTFDVVKNGPPPPHSDFNFYQPDCRWGAAGFVGMWGLKLQHDLALSTQIPNCFVNGGDPGKPISWFQPSNRPTNPNNLNLTIPYDRLYMKLLHNGLQNDVKGIVWYQGETDGGLSMPVSFACDYYNRLNELYSAWKADYPGFQRLFLVQIPPGCASNNSNMSVVREMQRRFANQHSDVLLMSTSRYDDTDRTSDECHFTIPGYKDIADNLAPLFLKTYYNQNLSASGILPPMIRHAYKTGSSQLCLEFDKNIGLVNPATIGGMPRDLKDYFFGPNKSSLALTGVSANANKVYLNFSGTNLPGNVTYLPDHGYHNGGVFCGPWITNASNTMLGATSFNEFPVGAPPGTSGWEKAWTNFGSNNISGHTIGSTDRKYFADLDGDGTDEMLCVQYTQGSNGDWMTLMKFNNLTMEWEWKWSNYGNGGALYPYRYNFIVGDFDGDGHEELLGNDNGGPGGWTTLFKWQNNAWVWAWTDGGPSTGHVISPFKDYMYSGDFDGDNKDEIVAFDVSTSPVQMREFEWDVSTSNFISSGNAVAGHPLCQYYTSLYPGNFEPDAQNRIELLGFNSSNSEVFSLNGGWNSIWNNGSPNLGGWTLGSNDRILAGNIDSDVSDELIFVQSGPGAAWATSMNLLSTGWSPNWSANPTSSSGPFIDDWALNPGNASDNRYYLMKPVATDPHYMMTVRDETCGYLVNMYKTDNPSGNYKLGTSVDVLEAGFDMDINTYPNPTDRMLYINFNRKSEVEIRDITGKVMHAESYEKGTSEIDIGEFDNGIYLLSCSDETGTHIKKIILQK